MINWFLFLFLKIGEIIPLKIIVNHFESYTRQNALEIELVRIVEIRTQK